MHRSSASPLLALRRTIRQAAWDFSSDDEALSHASVENAQHYMLFGTEFDLRTDAAPIFMVWPTEGNTSPSRPQPQRPEPPAPKWAESTGPWKGQLPSPPPPITPGEEAWQTHSSSQAQNPMGTQVDALGTDAVAQQFSNAPSFSQPRSAFAELLKASSDDGREVETFQHQSKLNVVVSYLKTRLAHG